ncbi:hypothetical protein TG4357_02477 [Thalassovita gelatinovora]|uniref:Flagellar assembly protein T N-terminal domain-containing protein n=1 Tax=Thalassovita gelatinovora TaxID=53501 RepID=A0A0P1FED6_THAGE|nr:hypothetical protein [Thalassovita gelatinovora]QIZ79617.1 hypothetical protein HFZ77_03545 [Thalassovita gelatinovora]CUH66544.1 hypothetical protein TG4357_02477 [Thalassovita gelatinovora]SEQ37698.1 hypothetical protein SAMN04488043_10513 [Thalassovita gelatinovora]
MKRWPLTLLLALIYLIGLPLAASAQAVWVEVIGHAVAANAKDKPAARRRALADALIAAGMAGGVSMKGHTVVDRGRVVRDLTMMRAAGRVLRYDNLGEAWGGNTIQIRLRALVAPLEGPACGARRHLVLVALPPDIRVSPNAPAWAAQLGAELYNDALARLDRKRSVTLDKVLARGQKPISSTKNTSMSYASLTRGDVRLQGGDTQLATWFDINTEYGDGKGRQLVIRVQIQLIEGTGQITERTLSNAVKIPGSGPISSALGAKRPKLKSQLAKGYSEILEGLIDLATCTPVAAHVVRSGGKLSVPVGSRQGLTRGALAFTENPASDFEALEIIKLGRDSAVLRPLDPAMNTSVFDGRMVRFVDAGK